MGADPADIAERLSGIADELADLALDRLRQASDSVRSGDDPDPSVTAEAEADHPGPALGREGGAIAGGTVVRCWA